MFIEFLILIIGICLPIFLVVFLVIRLSEYLAKKQFMKIIKGNFNL